MTMLAVTCRLTAEYGISSIPEHSTYEDGTYRDTQRHTCIVKRLLIAVISCAEMCQDITINFFG